MAQSMVWGIALAFLLGMFGQGIRVIAGLKKQGDAASNNQTWFSLIDPKRLVVSLFIGSIAGMAAFLGYWYGGSIEGVDPSKAPVAFGIVAAGYSGADFIEAFAKKYLPKTGG